MVEVNFKFDLDQYVTADKAQLLIDTYPSGNGIFAKYVHSILNEGHTIILAFDIADLSVVGKNHATAVIRDHIFKTLAEAPKQIPEGPSTTGSITKDTLNQSVDDVTNLLGKGAKNLLDGLKDLNKTIIAVAVLGAVIIGGVIVFRVHK